MMGNKLASILNQTIRIPAPLLTEKNLPDQTGKVVIITGGYAGLGQELSRILYQKNAVIYILGRSAEKAKKSISATRLLYPDSRGRLEFIAVDLADLKTVKPAVVQLLGKERKVDVLVNNAGVMFPPAGSVSAQNHELQLATNALGHYLLTTLLLPILQDTRILWAGSLLIDLQSPPSGISFTTAPLPSPINHSTTQTNYAQSKTASLFLAVAFGQKYPEKNLTSTSFNPGSLDTELLRHTNPLVGAVAKRVLLHKAVFGAYTELGVGWGELGEDYVAGKGWYGIPWGRNGWSGLRGDILAAVDEGGVGEKLWQWCERVTVDFK